MARRFDLEEYQIEIIKKALPLYILYQEKTMDKLEDDDKKSITLQYIESIKSLLGTFLSTDYFHIPVRCIETGEVFENATAAATAKKTTSKKIRMMCEGKKVYKSELLDKKTLHWEYVK